MQSIVGNNQTNTLDNVTNENVLPPTQGETESKDNSATNLDEVRHKLQIHSNQVL